MGEIAAVCTGLSTGTEGKRFLSISPLRELASATMRSPRGFFISPAFFSGFRSLGGRVGRCFQPDRWIHAGVTQLVESQPSKLLVAGSSPVSRSKWMLSALCLVERSEIT